MIDGRQRGGTVAQLKVASKRRVQVAMEGKARERWGGLYIVGYFDASLRMGKDHKGRDERNTKDKVGPER